MTLPLRISQRTIQRRRNIHMKKRPIQPLNNSLPLGLPLLRRAPIRLTILQLLIQTPVLTRAIAAPTPTTLFNSLDTSAVPSLNVVVRLRLRQSALQRLIVPRLCCRSRTIRST